MKPRPTDAAGPSSAPGVVREGEVYRLKELQRRMGWGEHAVRQAKLAGLRLVPFGREKFVLGADVLEFFRRLGDGASHLQTDDKTRISGESGVHDANR